MFFKAVFFRNFWSFLNVSYFLRLTYFQYLFSSEFALFALSVLNLRFFTSSRWVCFVNFYVCCNCLRASCTCCFRFLFPPQMSMTGGHARRLSVHRHMKDSPSHSNAEEHIFHHTHRHSVNVHLVRTSLSISLSPILPNPYASNTPLSHVPLKKGYLN